jgi:hypothetical protein
MNSRENYKQLQNTYVKENFFVSYAVNGPIVDKEHGDRLGMPVNHPISGPVHEPSPLNTRYQYTLPEVPIEGIL